MKQQDEIKYVGSMQQLAYVRPIAWQEGRAHGMKGFDVQNGALHFQVMTDKCLDISSLSYKGINFCFLAKQGLIGRMDYDTHGEEGRKNLMGGMMFTCGLENTCLPCQDKDASYPMHGRIRSAPAEHVGADADWLNGSYVISVKGQMREAEIFGKNLVLRREIKTIYGQKSIEISDTIENRGYQKEVMMLLYHINAGYPFLDENAQVILPSKKMMPRDEAAKTNMEAWMKMEKPRDNEPEQVYLHELYGDENGDTFAAFVNTRLKLGLLIEFNKTYLPNFVQWKSIASGDYVMGLEPTNANVYGRVNEGEQAHSLMPGEKEVIKLKLTVLEGEEELGRLYRKKVMENNVLKTVLL